MSQRQTKKQTEIVDVAWQKHCREAKNEPMRQLGELAARRHLSMRTVAGRIGVDVRALARYFQSTRPAVKTLAKVAKALDIRGPDLTARALSRTLRVDDLSGVCNAIGYELEHADELFGKRKRDTALAFSEFVAAHPQARMDVCVASILAQAPFGFRDRKGSHFVLGLKLDAVECALAPHGFSLMRFVQDLESLLVSRGEAFSWFSLLCKAARLSDGEALEIEQIAFGCRFDGYSIDRYFLLRDFVSSSKDLDGESPDGFALRFAAILAAQEAYRARVRNGLSSNLKTKIGKLVKRWEGELPEDLLFMKKLSAIAEEGGVVA
jgi:transcriptional regulator with XRE-family HTH domain